MSIHLYTNYYYFCFLKICFVKSWRVLKQTNFAVDLQIMNKPILQNYVTYWRNIENKEFNPSHIEMLKII